MAGHRLQVVDSYYVDGRCIAASELQHCNVDSLGHAISVALQYDGAFKRVMSSSPAILHELSGEDLALFSCRQGWAPKCVVHAAQRAAAQKNSNQTVAGLRGLRTNMEQHQQEAVQCAMGWP